MSYPSGRGNEQRLKQFLVYKRSHVQMKTQKMRQGDRIHRQKQVSRHEETLVKGVGRVKGVPKQDRGLMISKILRLFKYIVRKN